MTLYNSYDLPLVCGNDLLFEDMNNEFEANYVTQAQFPPALLSQPLSELFRTPENEKQLFNRCRSLHTIRHMMDQETDSFSVQLIYNTTCIPKKNNLCILFRFTWEML